MTTLLTHEQRTLARFIMADEQRRRELLEAALRDPQVGAPLIIAYRMVMENKL